MAAAVRFFGSLFWSGTFCKELWLESGIIKIAKLIGNVNFVIRGCFDEEEKMISSVSNVAAMS